MEKVILTRGRCGKDFFIKQIPEEMLSGFTIACHEGEGLYYESTYGKFGVLVKEYSGNNVGEARHWVIMNSESDKVMFFEDNICLHSRGHLNQFGKSNKANLYKITTDFFEKEVCKIFFKSIIKSVEEKLCLPEYALVGISARGGNNHIQEDFAENCRIYGCWAIDKSIYMKIKENLCDVKYREDFYIMLSLMRSGYKIGSFYKYAFTKVKGIGSDGGCSNYRTQEGTDQNAIFLAKEFHPFVKVVEKERLWKGYSGMVKDVRIQWKKMYSHYSK